MRRPSLSALLGVLLVLRAGPGHAASPSAPTPPEEGYSLFDPVPDADLRDMSTNRPSHMNTPQTVDAGHVQFEVGLADFTRQWVGTPSTSFATGEIQARFGLLPSLEATVAITSFETGPGGAGFGDVTLGGKLNLWGNQGSDATWATALGLQPQVKLPTAGDRRGNGHVEANIAIPFTMNLPGAFHLGLELVPGFGRDDRNTATVGTLQEVVSLDRVFGTADLYLEYWTSQGLTGTRPQHSADAGVTLPVGKNLVVDSGVFFGLNRATPSFEYVAGVSVRF